jgi:hypothetical protein
MEEKYISVGGYYMYYEDNAYYGADYLQSKLDAHEGEIAPIISSAMRDGKFNFEDQNGKNYSLIYDQANNKFRIISRD